MTGIDGWCLDASFKTLCDKIAAELCDKTQGRFWTEVLSSKKKRNSFFWKAICRCLAYLIIASFFFFFSTPESADSKNFSGSKAFLLYKCWKCKKLWVVSRNSARVQNYSNCSLVLRKKISSAFRVQRCEPRSFAKCWQNLLIEKKSVERLWRFSKGWT